MLLHPRKWLIVSAVTFIITVMILVLQRPTAGIDFTGGSLLEIDTTLGAPAVRDMLFSHDFSATVQVTSSSALLIRLRPLTPDEHEAVLAVIQDADALASELRFETIGPTIGAQLRQKALVAVSATMAVIILFLAYTFRDTRGLIKSWKFGVAAVVALLHDLLVVTASFGLLRHFGATIDSLFVTAILAIIGYSVHDTIIIFDRARREWLKARTENLAVVLDQAVKSTLIRSLNTSITTLLVLTALLLLGGDTLRWFIAALFIGTIAGTYSSFFVAPPVLHWLARRS